MNITIKKKFTAVLAVLLAVIVTFAFTACGSSGDKDTLNVGITQVADQPFDPGRIELAYLEQIEPAYDTLLSVDSDGKYQPNLAKSWKLSSDKKKFTIKLRKDVKFQNGDKMTSKDVKFSLNYYAKGKKSVQADKALLARYLGNIETPDDYTVVVNFKSPFTEFEYLISEGGTGTGIVLPEKYYKEKGAKGYSKKPIGTGPYKVESFEAGKQIKFTANEDYFKGAPKFKNLVFKQEKEESTKVSDLKAGSLDFAEIEADSVKSLKDSDDLKIKNVDYMSTLGIFISGAYDNNGKATQNQQVRQALNLAIDRDSLVKSTFNGNAKATGIWGVFPFTSGYDGSKSSYEYSLSKAKSLLKQAGYPDRFKDPVVKLYITESSYNKAVAQAVTDFWKKAGLQTKIITTDSVSLSNDYMSKPLSKDFEGAAYLFDAPKKYSVHDATQPFYPDNSPFTLIPGNSELDSNVEKLVTETGKEREATTDAILDTVKESGVSIGLAYPGAYYAVGSKIKSWDPDYSAHWGNWFYTFKPAED